MNKLKPCPFCGGEANLIKQTDSYKINPVHILHSFYVECPRCGMNTKTFRSDIWQDKDGNVHIEHNGAEEAIEAWNRREGEQECISRQAAIEALDNIKIPRNASWYQYYQQALTAMSNLPSAQPEQKYTLEEVAEILSAVIGDECACNINGIDEWLPERCKYTEIGEECPNPKEKHGCWMQFLLQGGGAYMRGEQE